MMSFVILLTVGMSLSFGESDVQISASVQTIKKSPIIETTVRRRRYSCADYSILSNMRTADTLDRRCDRARAVFNDANRTLIDSLNPAAEASAAADRGDFRIAGIMVDFPPPPSDPPGKPWITPGARCASLNEANIAMFAQFTDGLTISLGRPQSAVSRFVETYNRSIIGDPRFETRWRCTVELQSDQSRHTKPRNKHHTPFEGRGGFKKRIRDCAIKQPQNSDPEIDWKKSISDRRLTIDTTSSRNVVDGLEIIAEDGKWVGVTNRRSQIILTGSWYVRQNLVYVIVSQETFGRQIIATGNKTQITLVGEQPHNPGYSIVVYNIGRI